MAKVSEEKREKREGKGCNSDKKKDFTEFHQGVGTVSLRLTREECFMAQQMSANVSESRDI